MGWCETRGYSEIRRGPVSFFSTFRILNSAPNFRITNPFRSSYEFINWKLWNLLAAAGWGISVLVLVIMTFAKPGRRTNIHRYLEAGRNWFDGLPLYITTPNKGFVYPPFSAVCYAVTTIFPPTVAGALWHVIQAALLASGLVAIMMAGPYKSIPAYARGLVMLLVLPLCLGNLDSTQANPIVIGLMMIAIAAASAGRWNIAAIAIAGAFYWKLYPLALGMLLFLVAPKKITLRLIIALVVLGLVPFLFQKPDYVIDQYRLWFDTRTGDNRLVYDLKIAPLDFWFVAVRMLGLPISPMAYRIIQLGAAAAIAAFCLYGVFRRWDKDRLLGGMFALVCTWIVLFGPATENHTYLMIAPVAVIGLIDSWAVRRDLAGRILATTAYTLLLLAILRLGFAPQAKGWLLTLQPVGAMVYLAYALRHFLRDGDWAGLTGSGNR